MFRQKRYICGYKWHRHIWKKTQTILINTSVMNQLGVSSFLYAGGLEFSLKWVHYAISYIICRHELTVNYFKRNWDCWDIKTIMGQYCVISDIKVVIFEGQYCISNALSNCTKPNSVKPFTSFYFSQIHQYNIFNNINNIVCASWHNNQLCMFVISKCIKSIC